MLIHASYEVSPGMLVLYSDVSICNWTPKVNSEIVEENVADGLHQAEISVRLSDRTCSQK